MSDTGAPDSDDEHERALFRLLDQAVAGVALVEELLDVTQPGWDAPRKGRRRASGPAGSLDYIRSALHTVWINVGWLLLKEHDVEPFRITPMAMRGEEGYTIWQRGPDGGDDITTVAAWDPPQADDAAAEPVRPVRRPQERLYTLQEARALLGGCVEHVWVVDVDASGQPSGVRCARPGCEERRPVSGPVS